MPMSASPADGSLDTRSAQAERLTASISRPQRPNDRTKGFPRSVFQPWANSCHMQRSKG